MTGSGAATGDRRRGDVSVTRIAQLAGVSVPTVSKVLNGRAGVADSTRQRVEEVIRENGYRRPEAAEPTPVVEVLFPSLDTPWALEILRGVTEVAGPRGLAVAVTEMQGRTVPPRAWAQDVLARRPVGVIAITARLTAGQQTQLASRRMPLVALDPTGDPQHEAPSVGAMNWNGGLAAARHLLELGHRRIAVITGPADLLCCRARLDGFRAGLDAAGVTADPDLVRTGELIADEGVRVARELLALTDPPTAIFTANDLQAFGVYAAAHAAGVRIPADLSVVGFDDLPVAQWSVPPLTTVRQPLLRMGATAMELLLTLAAGREPTSDRIELPTVLVPRASTAPPGRSATPGTAARDSAST